MKTQVSDQEAADKALEEQFEGQGFLEKPYNRYRFHNGFLAGCAHKESEIEELKNAVRDMAEALENIQDMGELKTNYTKASFILTVKDTLSKHAELISKLGKE